MLILYSLGFMFYIIVTFRIISIKETKKSELIYRRNKK